MLNMGPISGTAAPTTKAPNSDTTQPAFQLPRPEATGPEPQVMTGAKQIYNPHMEADCKNTLDEVRDLLDRLFTSIPDPDILAEINEHPEIAREFGDLMDEIDIKLAFLENQCGNYLSESEKAEVKSARDILGQMQRSMQIIVDGGPNLPQAVLDQAVGILENGLGVLATIFGLGAAAMRLGVELVGEIGGALLRRFGSARP